MTPPAATTRPHRRARADGHTATGDRRERPGPPRPTRGERSRPGPCRRRSPGRAAHRSARRRRRRRPGPALASSTASSSRPLRTASARSPMTPSNRQFLVSRTTGADRGRPSSTRAEDSGALVRCGAPTTSARTAPASTGANWSGSPTRIRVASRRSAESSRAIRGSRHHRGLIDDHDVMGKGIPAVVDEPAAGTRCQPSRRWSVVARRPARANP